MGKHIRLHQVTATQRAVSCPCLHYTFHYCLCYAAGILADTQKPPMDGRQLEGRAADAGFGNHGRICVFPHGERGHEPHHHNQHIAHSMYVSALRRTPHQPVLQVGTHATDTGGGLPVGSIRNGYSGAQRPLRAPSLPSRRHPRLLRMPVLGSVLAATGSCRQAIRLYIHNPKGILLRIGIHHTILPARTRHAACRRTHAPRHHRQPAVSRLHSIHAVLPHVDMGHRQDWSRYGNQLRLLQPRGDYHPRLDNPVRTNNNILPHRHPADSHRNVSR